MGAPEEFDRKGFLYRIGTFFLLLGIGLLIFFVMSESAGQVKLSYFCWSTILLVVGFLFRAQLKKTVKPSGRFSVLKRLAPKPKQDQGKK